MSIAINGASNEFYARRDAAGSSSRTYHANGAARAILSASFFMAFLSEANRGRVPGGLPAVPLSNREIASFGDAQVVHTTLPFPGRGQQSVFISNCRRIRAVRRIFLNFQLIIGYAKLNDGFLCGVRKRLNGALQLSRLPQQRRIFHTGQPVIQRQRGRRALVMPFALERQHRTARLRPLCRRAASLYTVSPRRFLEWASCPKTRPPQCGARRDGG